MSLPDYEHPYHRRHNACRGLDEIWLTVDTPGLECSLLILRECLDDEEPDGWPECVWGE